MKWLRQEGGRGFGLVKFLLILALVALVVAAVWIFRPDLFRIQGVQTPVSVTVRESLVGRGKVLQIRNVSEEPLEGVVVRAIKPSTNEQARLEINRLKPDEATDIGWVEWNWKLEPGQRIEVDARGYAPIVFSSKQLGIE